jgi:hypothetical protein
MIQYIKNLLLWLDAGVASLIGRDFRTTLTWNMTVLAKFRNQCVVCKWFYRAFTSHCERSVKDWDEEDVDYWMEHYDVGLWKI